MYCKVPNLQGSFARRIHPCEVNYRCVMECVGKPICSRCMLLMSHASNFMMNDEIGACGVAKCFG